MMVSWNAYQDLKSRVIYSVVTRRLHDDAMGEFIRRELDRIDLPHGTFSAVQRD